METIPTTTGVGKFYSVNRYQVKKSVLPMVTGKPLKFAVALTKNILQGDIWIRNSRCCFIQRTLT